MSDQNGSSENKNRQRLDQMEDVIQSMIDATERERALVSRKFELMLELVGKQHEVTMEELHEMRDLQKEMRIDIMALFQGNDNLRKAMQQYFERHP